MNTKEIQEQIATIRRGEVDAVLGVDEYADTMEAMLKENEELRKMRKLCADSLNGMNDKRYRLKEALLDIRVEAGDWLQGVETSANRTGKPSVTIKAVYQMADKALKAQAVPESTLPVQPDAPDR